MTNQSVRIRQWVLLIGLVSIAVTFAVVIAILSQDKKKTEKTEPTTTINLKSDSFNEEHFVTTYGAQISSLQKEVEALTAQLKREEERKEKEKRYQKHEENFDAAFDYVETQQLGALNSSGEVSQSGSLVTKFHPKNDTPRLVIKRVSDITPEEKPGASKTDDIAKNRTKEKKADELLITGSFARARLLNGVEAPTGGQANGNPVPMLLEIKIRPFYLTAIAPTSSAAWSRPTLRVT